VLLHPNIDQLRTSSLPQNLKSRICPQYTQRATIKVQFPKHKLTQRLKWL